ncbi:winged helix-turn-helix transcriptional regulator [Marimonas lutisalis]|uniref:winged helix-turn-helix transcriptional regulator n=1 Tax=Marimonas lutisalis TaxID=2545756 RepID=UPI0010F4852E|nr:helix-turn-helix domain-containing protein [Marimonas lutisalis]
MSNGPYGMICPITHACQVLEPKWTIPILTELWAGSTRFNELRRGIGNISPALLTRRLKELEAFGLVERVEDPATGSVDYIRTQSAIDLEPALNALAMWAQKHVEAETVLCDIDVSGLMWQMRKRIAVEELPRRRIVMQFRFADEGLDYDTYWALIQDGTAVEVCTAIPGYDVDLYVETDSVSLAAVLTGRSTVARECDAGALFLSGDALLIRTIERWLKKFPYEPEGGAAQLMRGTGRCRTAAGG